MDERVRDHTTSTSLKRENQFVCEDDRFEYGKDEDYDFDNGPGLMSQKPISDNHGEK